MKPRTRRWALLGVALVLAAGIAAGISALNAYRHVARSESDARYVITHLREVETSAGRSALQSRLSDISSNAEAAQSSLTVHWSAALFGWMPGIGADFRNVGTLLEDERAIAENGIQLLHRYGQFQDAFVHTTPQQVGAFRALLSAMTTSQSTLAHLPRVQRGLLNPLAATEHTAQEKIDHIQRLFDTGVASLHVAQDFLGFGEPKTILVLAENNAEMRDEGTVLSYSLFQAHDGTLTLLRSGRPSQLNLAKPVAFPVSPGAAQYYWAAQPAQIWQSVDVPGDFRVVGRTAAEMFTAATGIQVDDVVGIDVPALAALVQVGGPLTVPSIGEALTSSNMATVLLHDLYAKFPAGSQAPRYNALSQVSEALLQRIHDDRHRLQDYLKVLAQLLPTRHFLMWAANPETQRSIRSLGGDGCLSCNDAVGSFHVAVQNDVASKLDYYIHVNDDYVVNVLPNGSADVSTTVVIHNDAPAGQPPSYQLGPDGGASTVEGEYVGNIYQWTPPGSTAIGGAQDEGMMLSGTSVSILPGHTESATFWASAPGVVTNGQLRLHFIPQASLYPQTIVVRVERNGHVVGVFHRLLSRNWELRIPILK